jgi:hypothetical protein
LVIRRSSSAGAFAATGKAGAAMSWNPLFNGRLASGVPNIPAYLQAGIRVGMAVDGEASADLADPFDNMCTGLYAIRDKYESATIMSPYDVLCLHTMGSAMSSTSPAKLAHSNPTNLPTSSSSTPPVSALYPIPTPHSSSSPQNPTSKASMSAAPSA